MGAEIAVPLLTAVLCVVMAIVLDQAKMPAFVITVALTLMVAIPNPMSWPVATFIILSFIATGMAFFGMLRSPPR